jgi:hypothetical protein
LMVIIFFFFFALLPPSPSSRSFLRAGRALHPCGVFFVPGNLDQFGLVFFWSISLNFFMQ